MWQFDVDTKRHLFYWYNIQIIIKKIKILYSLYTEHVDITLIFYYLNLIIGYNRDLDKTQMNMRV